MNCDSWKRYLAKGADSAKTKRGTPSGMSRPARPPKPSFVPVNLQPT